MTAHVPSVPRSGRQLRIAAHGYEATIASVGASLRELRFGGRDLVVPFAADEVRPAYRGVTLAPWPNRIVDGRYSFAGVEYQVPVNEVGRGQALHGLLCWAEYADRLVADDRVTLCTVLEPSEGYPFRLEVETTFALSEAGLTQTVTVRNIGADAAPWGTGPHPYLVAGDGIVDDWTLTLPASRVLAVTEDRLSPVALDPITDHPEWDFRSARVLGDVFIDHAFTALEREDDVAEVRVVAASGAGVAMRFDSQCEWVQIHTADRPDAPEISRVGLAVEPMTCAPDAFNSGAGLVVVEPGDEHSAAWTISAV